MVWQEDETWKLDDVLHPSGWRLQFQGFTPKGWANARVVLKNGQKRQWLLSNGQRVYWSRIPIEPPEAADWAEHWIRNVALRYARGAISVSADGRSVAEGPEKV